MKELTNDDEKVHIRRLFLFKYRLNKLLKEKDLALEKLGGKINDNFLDDVRFKDDAFNRYAISNPAPEEPNVLIAIGIARTLGVNLNYLFGLEWGELIYSKAQTARSLLINVFRALMIEGVEVKTDYVHGETTVYSTDKYFQEFLDKVDLKDDLESNFPVLFQILLDYMQDTTNTRLDSDHILSNIRKDESFTMPELIYQPEVYLPIAWDIILDTLPTNVRPKVHRENQYPPIHTESTNKEQAVLTTFRENLQKCIGNVEFSMAEWNKCIPLSDTTINKYLDKGSKNVPLINHVIDISYASDVRLEYLLGLDSNPGRFPSLHTMESRFLNLFKALKHANFKLREGSNHLNVAFSKNPYIYQLFDCRDEIHSVSDAHKIISDEMDSRKLRVYRGEILPYDKRSEEDPLKRLQLLLRKNLFDSNV